jgi:hypothetical protein
VNLHPAPPNCDIILKSVSDPSFFAVRLAHLGAFGG